MRTDCDVEATHFWNVVEQAGLSIDISSPVGGDSY